MHLRSLTAFSILALLVVLAGTGINLLHPVTANAASNTSTISFQARLENSTGSIVPDGSYNIEFKLYNALTSSGSSQGSCTGDAACLWTEDYLNSASHGVSVVDGYLSVNLGSITSFPSTINWNQPVYLTMNIGGTGNPTPVWDGEMTPRLQLTAVPDAFQAQTLQSTIGSYTSSLTFPTSFTGNDSIVLPDASGTVCLATTTACGFALSTGAAGYIQNTTSVQAAANIAIQSGTTTAVTETLKDFTGQTADLLDFDNSSGVVMGEVTSTGALQGFNSTGANVAGGNLVLAGGQGTGSANGGNINFQIAKPGTSGSGVNGEATVESLSGVNGAATFENSVNSTTAFQVQNASGVQVLNVNTTNSIVSVQGINSDAVIGSENMLSNTNFSSNWAGTGWTFSSSNAIHTSGTTPAVYSGFTPVAGVTYQITYTFTGASGNGTDSITPNIGGNNAYAIYNSATTDTVTIPANTTGKLEFIPSTAWTGTITSVSVKAITASNSVLQVMNSSGTSPIQFRSSATNSIDEFIGYGAGQNNATGNWDTAVGYLALQGNTSGYGNAAFGDYSLEENTTGALNSAFGDTSLQLNTTGYSNSAFGSESLSVNTTGYGNSAFGQASLQHNTSGFANTAVGQSALYSNTSGFSNTAIGYAALNVNTTGVASTAIGTYSLANDVGTDNTALGSFSLQGSTTASYDVAVGETSLYSENGAGDVGIGFSAGQGGTSGFHDSSGYENTYIGYETGPSTATGLQNATAIGTYAMVGESNAIVLGCISGSNGCATSTQVGIGTTTPVATFDTVGTGVFQSTTGNSLTAFQIQNASTSVLLNADTTNMRISIGTGGTATGQLYVAGTGGSLLTSLVAGTSGDEDTGEQISGHYLYINEFTLGKLAVYDITNPSSPTLIGTPITLGASPVGMSISGHYLYIAEFGAAQMQVVDISNPNAPTVVSTATTSGNPSEITLSGHYLYIGTGYGVDVFDISNPVTPVKLTTVSTTTVPNHVIASGRYVYAAETNNGTKATVQAIDTTTNTVVGNYTMAGGSAGSPQTSGGKYGVNEMTIDGRYLYVTNEGYKSIDVFDISNPAATLSAPTQTISTGATLMPFSLSTQGRYLYASLSTNYATPAALATYDISNVSGITQVNSTTSTYVPEDIITQGRYAYETGYTGYLQSFDLGGAYVQQLESGGLETGTLAVDSDANFNGNASIAGGLQVGQSAQINGGLGVNGVTTITNNSTVGFVVQSTSGADTLNVDTTNHIVTVSGTSTDAVLSADKMLSDTNFSSNWTGTGWTFTSAHAAHTSGTTPAVYSGFTPVAGTTYQITYTFTGGNAIDSITPNIGGSTTGVSINDTGLTDTQVITAVNTTGLSFTPTTGWTGTITSVNVEAITSNNAVLQVVNSAGVTSLQVRTSTANISDEFIGLYSGIANATGYNDTAMGYAGLQNNTSGYSNSAFGNRTLQSNTTGYDNSAFGDSALLLNTVGIWNSAFGQDALEDNNTGDGNSAFGQQALTNDNGGSYNVGVGDNSLSFNGGTDYNVGVGAFSLQTATANYNTAVGANAMQNAGSGGYNAAFGYEALNVETGADNIGIGYNAGSGNSLPNADTAGTANLYLGYETGTGTATALQNASAIGAQSVVSESNALVLGCISGINGCTVSTQVGIGTSTPSATFDTVGTAIIQSATGNSATAFQVQNAVGADILDVDTTSTAANGNQLNYLTYPGFESGSFSNASAGWAPTASATLTQNSVKTNTYNGSYSAKVVTSAATQGLKTSSFVSAPPIGTYLVSFYVEGSSGSLTSNSFVVTSTDGTTHNCSPASGTTVSTTGFTQLYCSLTTTGVMTALQITYATSGTTFYVDGVQVQSNVLDGTTITVPSAYQIGAIQLRGVITNPLALMNNANSTSALQVTNATGMSEFDIDTIDNVDQIGSSTTDANSVKLALDQYNAFTDNGTCNTATAPNGALYYNSSTNAIRSCINGGWEDMATTSGLGIILFGVVPDSTTGTGQGDLGGAVSETAGPCKVYIGSTAATVSWTACAAYSGGRKVNVTAATNQTVTGLTTNTFSHLCISTTTGQPTFTTASTTETANLPTWSVNNPVLCLADIKGSAASTISNIYDTRTFTNTSKEFGTVSTAAPLGTILTQTTTANVMGAASTTAANQNYIRGIEVAANSAASATTVNVIIADGGQGWVKAAGTSSVQGLVVPVTSGTAGYSITVTTVPASPTPAIYDVLGISQRTISTSCTAASTTASTDCQYSQFVDINIK